jgi:hypothetical protein
MEEVIVQNGAKIVIIDNITFLRTGTETAKDALPLMKELKALKRKYNLSLLVLAHTPKRDSSREITINDLQGSKMLINFCDSAFAIGASYTNKNIRYIKQINARNCEIVYDVGNVAVFEVIKPDVFLHFNFLENDAENQHLRVFVQGEDRKKTITEMRSQGLSNRKIGERMGISEGMVRKVAKS